MISLLILVLVLGLIFWLLQYLPIPEPFRMVLLVIMVIIIIVWLLGSLGNGPRLTW